MFRKTSFYLAVLGVVATVLLVRRQSARPADPGPVSAPARSPYDGKVAATGLIEASRENVKVASPRPAVVTRVHVKVQQDVKAGDPLLQLDDREASARVAATLAQLAAAQAQLAVDQNLVEDQADQLARLERLERDRVASKDELSRRQFALAGATAKAAASKAQVAAIQAQLDLARTELSVLTVRAPRDGAVLQVNVREGEFAPAAALAEPLILLGDTRTLQVRAEIDEQNAVLVHPGAPAVGSLKGHAERSFKLRFVRVEPFVVPKRSLTGDSLERVDTRVLQVIYAFDRPAFPAYVGQQVDVFIDREAAK
ncbi:MAG: efflux RND transporter periplasmic adaptor subunit [Verrucomicrobiota bacterium]|jgi:RND family efflux transporter MFP subunit